MSWLSDLIWRHRESTDTLARDDDAEHDLGLPDG